MFCLEEQLNVDRVESDLLLGGEMMIVVDQNIHTLVVYLPRNSWLLENLWDPAEKSENIPVTSRFMHGRTLPPPPAPVGAAIRHHSTYEQGIFER